MDDKGYLASMQSIENFLTIQLSRQKYFLFEVLFGQFWRFMPASLHVYS